jgi:hypothetical protein
VAPTKEHDDKIAVVEARRVGDSVVVKSKDQPNMIQLNHQRREKGEGRRMCKRKARTLLSLVMIVEMRACFQCAPPASSGGQKHTFRQNTRYGSLKREKEVKVKLMMVLLDSIVVVTGIGFPSSNGVR